jgi:altronate dehydratase small subunit
VSKGIILNINDNVATVVKETLKDEKVMIISENGEEIKNLKALENIPFGHKISLKKIKKQESIIKCGEVMGKAIKEIEEGSYVHIHNVSGVI